MVYMHDLRDRMKLLLTEVICQICTKEVPHKYQIHIEGTICITSDSHPAFAIQIAQLLSKASDIPGARSLPKTVYQPSSFGGPSTPTDGRGFGPGGPLSSGSNPLSPPGTDSAGGGGEQCAGPVLDKLPCPTLGSRFGTIEQNPPERDLHLKRALMNRHDSELDLCQPVDLRGSSSSYGETSRRERSDSESLDLLAAASARKMSHIDDPEDIVKNVQRNARQVIRKVSVTENQGLGPVFSPTEPDGFSPPAELRPSCPMAPLPKPAVTEPDRPEPHDPHRDGPLRKRNKFDYCREIKLQQQLADAGLNVSKYKYPGDSIVTVEITKSANEQTSPGPRPVVVETAVSSSPVEENPPSTALVMVAETRPESDAETKSTESATSVGIKDLDSPDSGGKKDEKMETETEKDTPNNEVKGHFTVKDKVRNMIFQREKSVERLRTNSTGSSSVIRDILQSTCPSTPVGMYMPNFLTGSQLQRTPSIERIGLARQGSIDEPGTPGHGTARELHINTSLSSVSTPTQSLSGPPSFKLKDARLDPLQSPGPLPSPVMKFGQHFTPYLATSVSSAAMAAVPGKSTPGSAMLLDYIHPHGQRPTLLPLTLACQPDKKDGEAVGEPRVRTTSGSLIPGSPLTPIGATPMTPVNYSSISMEPGSGYKLLSLGQMKAVPTLLPKHEPGTPTSSNAPTTPGGDPKQSGEQITDLVKSIMDTQKGRQFNLGHLSKETINGLIIVDHDTQKCISPQDYVYKDDSGETQVRACEYCGKHFKYFSKLMEHIRSHTKQKPYKCSICGRTYTYKGDLTVHIRQHSTSKPYVCDCGRSFASKKYLSVHQSQARIKGRHAISKDDRSSLYECSQCGKRFKFFSSFDLHLQTHAGGSGPHGDQMDMFECQSCNRLFRDHSLFVEHVLEHENGEHGTPKIKCEVEDEDFDECGEIDEEGNSSIEDKETGEVREDESDGTPPKGRCQTYRFVQDPDDRSSPNLAELRPLIMGKTQRATVEPINTLNPPPDLTAIAAKRQGDVVTVSMPEPEKLLPTLPISVTSMPVTSIPVSTHVVVSSEPVRPVQTTPQMVLPGTQVMPTRPTDLPGLPTQPLIPTVSVPSPFTISTLTQPLSSPATCQPLYASTLSHLTGLQGPTLQLHAVQPALQLLQVQPLLQSPVHQIPIGVPISATMKFPTSAPAVTVTNTTVSAALPLSLTPRPATQNEAESVLVSTQERKSPIEDAPKA